MNFIGLVKDNGEQYVFVYDRESTHELIRIFGDYASDPELSFTWFDAGYMSHRVRGENAKGESDA